MRTSLWLALLAASSFPAPSLADAGRDALFLDLVKERHEPPVSAERWGRHVGDDCVWVGRGLRVASKVEVQAMQMDTGKRVEILDFALHDYGDAAVLTYLVVEHQPQAGRDVQTRLRKMDTYVQRAGSWQLVANAEIVGKSERQPVELDPPMLDRVTGNYETRLGGKAVRTRIWREGSRLFAQTEGQEPGELLPLSPTLFYEASYPEQGGPVNEFRLDGRGRVTEWIYRDGDTEFRSRRLP